MKTEVSNMKTHSETKIPWWKQVMWLVVIYGASVLALGVVASLFRMMMTAAGMRSHCVPALTEPIDITVGSPFMATFFFSAIKKTLVT